VTVVESIDLERIKENGVLEIEGDVVSTGKFDEGPITSSHIEHEKNRIVFGWFVMGKMLKEKVKNQDAFSGAGFAGNESEWRRGLFEVPEIERYQSLRGISQQSERWISSFKSFGERNEIGHHMRFHF